MPPLFLFAFESQLTLATVADRADGFDAVFLLDRGVALRSVPGGWPMLSEDSTTADTWDLDERPDEVVMVMLAWLSLVMPRHEFSNLPLGVYLTGD